MTQRTGFLLGGFLFALAMLQSALVRSDIGHVIIGEFALTFFVGTILFSFARPRLDRRSRGCYCGFHAVFASYLPALQRHPALCSVAKSVD